MTARITHTLAIDEDRRRLLVYVHSPEEEPFLFLDDTYDKMRDMGFAEFAKTLGKMLIYGDPTLLKLFEDDIRASRRQMDEGVVTEPSDDDLEQALFAEIGGRRKVAMIVMKATDRFPGFWNGNGPYAKVDEALARLATRDDVRCFGDIKEWRHSEMSRKHEDSR